MIFRRKKKTKPETKPTSATPTTPEAIGGHEVPRHIGDVWRIVQEIAALEDPAWKERNVVQYYHQGAEAQKDILRWLAIYQKRCDPEHEFQFAERHPRYRGCCLIPRHWTSGTRWEAFDDGEWTRVPIPAQRDRESLEAAVDAYLDGAETPISRDAPRPDLRGDLFPDAAAEDGFLGGGCGQRANQGDPE
jgi:hypothetical protein